MWTRGILFATALAAGLAPAVLPDPRPPGHDAAARGRMGALQRSLGSVASIAASIEWIRYHEALRRGEETEGYGHARRALELDPRAAAGWFELAQHLIFTRGSFLENEGPEDRRVWIQSGLELLREGEARSSEPGELAHLAGMVRYVYLAGLPDEDLGWPGGREALLRQSLADFTRAADHGRVDAADALAGVRAELDLPSSEDPPAGSGHVREEAPGSRD